MADDLSQFFARKTMKSAGKKKGVIKLEVVGQQLERKARRQEEMDREDEEQEQRLQDDEHFIRKNAVEDSEWLDYNDPNKDIKLADFGIKDMNLTEQVELDEDEEEKAAPSEPTKTWNVPATQDENKAPEDLPPPPTNEGGTGKYIPAHMRRPQHARNTVDINNQEMFPSLAAAEQIEKHQKDSDKKEEQRKLDFLDKQAKLAEERQPVKMEPRRDNPHAYQVPARRTDAPADTAAEPTPPVSAAVNPNAYVPPNKRGQVAGVRPSEPPPPSSARPPSNAWGPPIARSEHAPPPTTTNRFDSLRD